MTAARFLRCMFTPLWKEVELLQGKPSKNSLSRGFEEMRGGFVPFATFRLPVAGRLRRCRSHELEDELLAVELVPLHARLHEAEVRYQRE